MALNPVRRKRTSAGDAGWLERDAVPAHGGSSPLLPGVSSISLPAL
jgi:hypothetical protein